MFSVPSLVVPRMNLRFWLKLGVHNELEVDDGLASAFDDGD